MVKRKKPSTNRLPTQRLQNTRLKSVSHSPSHPFSKLYMEILTKTGHGKREIRLFGVYVEKIKKIMLRDLMIVLSTIGEVFSINTDGLV